MSAAGGGDAKVATAAPAKREPKVASYKPPKRNETPLPDTATGSSAGGAAAAGANATRPQPMDFSKRESRVSLFAMEDDPYDYAAEEERLAEQEEREEAERAQKLAAANAKSAEAEAAAEDAAAPTATATAASGSEGKTNEPAVDPTYVMLSAAAAALYWLWCAESGGGCRVVISTKFKIRAVQPAFYTGIDMLSAEEEERRKKRAAKFNLPLYNPVAAQLSISEDDLGKREQRAAKFNFTADVIDKMEIGSSRAPSPIPHRPSSIHHSCA